MEQFKAILAEFKKAGGKGIIYGGALRDAFLGAPIKDIDIAVENTGANREAIEAFVSARRDFDPVETSGLLGTTVHSQELHYGHFPDVVQSLTVETVGQIPVNFVMLDMGQPLTMRLVTERCDFGICQIAMSNGGFFVTEEWYTDYRNKTFTYLRDPFDEAQYQRSLRRWDRFKDKYPEWTMVCPEAGLLAA